MKKKFAHIQEKSLEELKKGICDTKIELLTLRMQHARNTLKNPLLLREKRRLIARMQTALTMKEREVRHG